MYFLNVIKPSGEQKQQSTETVGKNSGMEENLLHGSEVPPDFSPYLDTPFNIYLLEAAQRRRKKLILVDPVTNDQLLTDDFVESSFKLAAYLQWLGCTPGQVIGIMCENDPQYLIIMQAVFQVGCIVTTFNPLYSDGELTHTFGITKPVLLFCSIKNMNKILKLAEKFHHLKNIIIVDKNAPLVSNTIIPVKILTQILKQPALSYKPVSSNSKDVAMILYSSGTTGFPKGVALSHTNVIYVIELIRLGRAYSIVGDYVILNTPMYHGYGMTVLLQCVAIDFTLVVMNRFDEQLFLSYIEKYKVTFLFVVPPVLVLLAKSSAIDSHDMSSIKYIMSGGAPLSDSAANDICRKLPNLQKRNLFQGYGMTETAFLCITSKNNDNKGKIACTGRLLPGIVGKIEDIETGEYLGPMKAGELCFKGPNIMIGYYNNEAETKKLFDSEGFFHSGDVAYYDDDGDIFIVDRVKELIKYKAFQVPPAELEALLLKHKDVKDVGVVGIPDELAGELPKAFVVKQPGANVTAGDIMQYVADRVSPQKKLRGGVTFVDEIPKSPSGKILRRFLKQRITSKL